MTNSRLNAVIKSRRTTSNRLAQIAWEYNLTAEQVLFMIWHEHTTADIINSLFARYSKFPEVSESVAKRIDFIGDYAIERLSGILAMNTHCWNREEWNSVMNMFKKNMQNHSFAQHSEVLYLSYDDCINKSSDDDESGIFDSEDAAHLSSFRNPFSEYDHLSYSSNIADWE